MMLLKPKSTSEGKSRFMHGALYHALYDRPLAVARRTVIDSVPAASAVLDIACGTGELCFELAERKECQLVGIDRSPRMIAFAQKRNSHPRVSFEHGDGTDLARFQAQAFDIATILFLMHEIPRDEQVLVLNEALRVARSVIVVDSQVPLPWTLYGMALRIVEAFGGPEHYRPFAAYLSGEGIRGILADPRVSASVRARTLFWHGCREMVILERPRTLGDDGSQAGRIG